MSAISTCQAESYSKILSISSFIPDKALVYDNHVYVSLSDAEGLFFIFYFFDVLFDN